jgi:hypothetical protein
MTLLIHFFGFLKLTFDLDAGRVVAVESRLAGIPINCVSGRYIAAAVRDAEMHAKALGYF